MTPLYVTKTFLPPFEEYAKLLREMWATQIVTNDGPLYQRFEEELRKFTGLPYLACQGNGTLSLQVGIRALRLTGEVITTPFTHYATSGSLVWEGCTPVYADIDPETLNLDPAKIEARLTERTSGILATHVYSNPCDVEAIGAVATRHGLKVMYDGAHAFGATLEGKSVLAYGDLTMTSFNATKGFHTMEGGALFARSAGMIDDIRRLGYFGMDKQKVIRQPQGMNAKLPEVCAAMGLANLPFLRDAIARRKRMYERYVSQLGQVEGLRCQRISGHINYSYMPVIARSEAHKRQLIQALQAVSVFPREYFSPSLEQVFSDRVRCPVADDIARRVLCLPMSDYLTEAEVDFVCATIRAANL